MSVNIQHPFIGSVYLFHVVEITVRDRDVPKILQVNARVSRRRETKLV